MLRHYCPERWMDSLPASCSQDWGPLCRETDTAPGGQRMRGYKQEAQWRWAFVKRRNIFSHAGTACNPLVRGTCKPLINSLLILLSPAVRKSIGFLWYEEVPERTALSAQGLMQILFFLLPDPLFTKYSAHSTSLTGPMPCFEQRWAWALLWRRN